ncbi:MAG: hypothetical protein U0L92_04730 [Clostridia bacterium]|nr:hypothetical protein [Clostridia bacterium]
MKMTFAVYIGNRGFFPGEVIDDARKEMCSAIERAGYGYITMDENKTRYGAVETTEEGRLFAEFLKENEGNYQGIILCLPNFGDENGGLVALKNANVPILVQAYPDELGKMDFAHRRDAMCGKFAMCNVLRQAGIPFTLTTDFVSKPDSVSFCRDLHKFAQVCRITAGMKSFNVGAIGARTTAFKTVRVDEAALQKTGINVETIDLSDVFARMRNVNTELAEKKKQEILRVTNFGNWQEEKLEKIAKLQVVLEDIVKEYQLQAMAIRCWPEFQTELAIAPCTNVGILNEKGIATACELDISNAVMMRALALAADAPTTLLDFNNNYGDDANKAIMFHCGPLPITMMNGKGETVEHLMFKKTFGDGTGVGVNKADILSGDITFGSLKTENGKLAAFISDGKFTDDAFDAEFFGSGKVVEKTGIYDICSYMAESGYKHHLCVALSDCKESIREAFTKYLGIETKVF